VIALRINTNIPAMNAHRQFGIVNNNLARNVERLSSGFRINRAADDAAGLAISEKMRAQIRGLGQASRNAQDAISLVQTAEGGMQTIHDILQRMRELVIQASSDTYSDVPDREAINIEVVQLLEEIDDISESTEFNQINLLDGSAENLVIQVGANYGQTLKISIDEMSVKSLVIGGVDASTQVKASQSIDITTKAINEVSLARAELGAMQNRLEFRTQNLDNQALNVSEAESRIRDVDMALEMTQFTRNSILQQSSMAMLAQANAMPQSVLQLLVND
jgi:flagellin